MGLIHPAEHSAGEILLQLNLWESRQGDKDLEIVTSLGSWLLLQVDIEYINIFILQDMQPQTARPVHYITLALPLLAPWMFSRKLSSEIFQEWNTLEGFPNLNFLPWHLLSDLSCGFYSALSSACLQQQPNSPLWSFEYKNIFRF